MYFQELSKLKVDKLIKLEESEQYLNKMDDFADK